MRTRTLAAALSLSLLSTSQFTAAQQPLDCLVTEYKVLQEYDMNLVQEDHQIDRIPVVMHLQVGPKVRGLKDIRKEIIEEAVCFYAQYGVDLLIREEPYVWSVFMQPLDLASEKRIRLLSAEDTVMETGGMMYGAAPPWLGVAFINGSSELYLPNGKKMPRENYCKQTTRVVIHEIGHLFSLTHDYSGGKNVMHPSALCDEPCSELKPEQVRQMRSFITGGVVRGLMSDDQENFNEFYTRVTRMEALKQEMLDATIDHQLNWHDHNHPK